MAKIGIMVSKVIKVSKPKPNFCANIRTAEEREFIINFWALEITFMVRLRKHPLPSFVPLEYGRRGGNIYAEGDQEQYQPN